MKNTAKITDTLIKVISYTLVVLVIAGVIGVVAYFTGGFTSGFKTFYLTIDGKDVLNSESGYSVDSENPLVVDVKYVFDFAGEEETGYSVKVVPNTTGEVEDFEFTVDGQKQSFKAQKDLTAGFHIEYGENSFTLTPIGNLDEIIQAVYPTSEIGGCDIPGYENMFALIVTSYDGSASVTVYFCCPDKVTGVELDKESITF